MSDEELVEVQLGGRRYLVGRLMGEGHLKELDGFLGEGGIEVGQQAEFSLVKVFPAVRTVTGYESSSIDVRHGGLLQKRTMLSRLKSRRA